MAGGVEFDRDAIWSDDYHHAVHSLLTGDREGFLTFFEETTRMIGELAQGGLNEEARVRHLHTLKGTAAMHGAQLIADICHRAEDALEINPEGIAPLISRL